MEIILLFKSKIAWLNFRVYSLSSPSLIYSMAKLAKNWLKREPFSFSQDKDWGGKSAQTPKFEAAKCINYAVYYFNSLVIEHQPTRKHQQRWVHSRRKRRRTISPPPSKKSAPFGLAICLIGLMSHTSTAGSPTPAR